MSLLIACGGAPKARETEKFVGDTGETTTTPVATPKPKPKPTPSPLSTSPSGPTTPSGAPIDDESQIPVVLPSGGTSASHGVGTACASTSQCSGTADVCLTEGYQDGMCSQACSYLCPGGPTFCVPDRSGSGGICMATCTTNADCRTGYECLTRSRFNDPTKTKNVCVPKNEQPRSCNVEFQALMSGATTWQHNDADMAQLCAEDVACNVNAPMSIPGVMNGVTIINDAQTVASNLEVSCKMAHTLLRMTKTLKKVGVSKVKFNRLYAVEKTALVWLDQPHALGTAQDVGGMLHGHGESIDISAMTINGTEYTVRDSLGTFDFPKTVTSSTPMKIALSKLHDEHIFNNIYSPFCNQIFGSDGTYGPVIEPFVHADIGTGTLASMMNPQYPAIDSGEQIACNSDFALQCE